MFLLAEAPDADGRVPLHPRDFHVLLALLREPLHGYGLVKAIEERTDGALRLDPANLYRGLQRLESEGMVAETPAPDRDADARRRYYRITDLGRRVLLADASRMRELAEAVEAIAPAGSGE